MAPTKESLIKSVLRNLIKLQNTYHVPLIFCYYSKYGIVPFGSENLVKKFLEELKGEGNEDEESWTETFDEDISDDIIKENPVNIVHSFVAQNSDDQITNVAQIASADVPDQDTPEKYINTDRDTLDRVINTPVYYMDTSVYNKINKIRGSYLI